MQGDRVAADVYHCVALRDDSRGGIERNSTLRRADSVRCCFGIRSSLLEHNSVAGLIDDIATDRTADVGSENDPATVYRMDAIALEGKRRGKAGAILAVESSSLPTAIACRIADDRTAQLPGRRIDGAEINDPRNGTASRTARVVSINGQARNIYRSGIQYDDLRVYRKTGDRRSAALFEDRRYRENDRLIGSAGDALQRERSTDAELLVIGAGADLDCGSGGNSADGSLDSGEIWQIGHAGADLDGFGRRLGDAPPEFEIDGSVEDRGRVAAILGVVEVEEVLTVADAGWRAIPGLKLKCRLKCSAAQDLKERIIRISCGDAEGGFGCCFTVQKTGTEESGRAGERLDLNDELRLYADGGQ